ncbi:hypothetical protein GCM10007855_14950 [Aliivibrio sifiae]|uniref:Uncharacterized protein n=1 Tax=Aliivibrio sifiae TaxID=566293 RepID=A0ABQ6AF78_9GAMM|nr:hypothetical protein GCM10007855_14950 [Aliivibrio sifiae]
MKRCKFGRGQLNNKISNSGYLDRFLWYKTKLKIINFNAYIDCGYESKLYEFMIKRANETPIDM